MASNNWERRSTDVLGVLPSSRSGNWSCTPRQGISWDAVQASRTAGQKTDKLRELLSEKGNCSELADISYPLPLDPSVTLMGVVPRQCSVFKSAKSPILLTFRVQRAPIPDVPRMPVPRDLGYRVCSAIAHPLTFRVQRRPIPHVPCMPVPYGLGFAAQSPITLICCAPRSLKCSAMAHPPRLPCAA